MIIVYDVVVKSKSPLCISLLIDGQGHRHDLSYIHLCFSIHLDYHSRPLYLINFSLTNLWTNSPSLLYASQSVKRY
jgi:hypothetical protein